jgi:pimeloyl-ACP methyl ester carboxylesterase
VSSFDVNGIAYSLSGKKGAPLVVLIHGLGLCQDLWLPHLPAFEAKFRVLRYDLYGHGDSAPVPETASLKVFSDQLSSLLDGLGHDKAAIVGFSIGGMINRRFALDYPDKLTALVILNSPHDRGEDAQQAVEARAQSVRDQGALSTMEDAMKRWFTPDYLATGDGPSLVRDWRLRVDPESYAQSAWVLANGVRELIGKPPENIAPTLVMTCENDTGSTPKMSRDIAAEYNDAETIIVPKLQHLGLMEDTAAFTGPIVEFLERSL